MHNSVKNRRGNISPRPFYRILPAVALLFFVLTGIIGVYITEAQNLPIMAESNIRVLIIDAGHGGADGGAVAADGTTESLINLAIAVKMEALAKLMGIECLMTRETEELSYPDNTESLRAMKNWDQNRRAKLIGSSSSAVYISIHQNFFPDPRPNGPQILYAASAGSAELADMAHTELTRCLSPDNRRVVMPAGEDIYLMKTAKCPAILAECGFMSNGIELEKLKSDSYQLKIASILISSYHRLYV